MAYIAIVAMLYALWRMYKNHKSKAKSMDETILIVIIFIALIVYFISRPSLVSDIAMILMATIICWYLIRRSGWKRPGS